MASQRPRNSSVASLSRSIKPEGRLAVEFGGHGNVAKLTAAIESVCPTYFSDTVGHPWYFPTIAEFATLLDQHGIEVTQAAMIDRPTPLEGDDGLAVNPVDRPVLTYYANAIAHL